MDSCEYCGADRSPDFVADDHREGVCNRGSIACTLCAKTFTLYSHYEAHKKCHQKLKQRQYPCQTCGKVSSARHFPTLPHKYSSSRCRAEHWPESLHMYVAKYITLLFTHGI